MTQEIHTNPNYYYKFIYKYDDTYVEHSFNADADLDRILTHFKNFCKGCSWTDEQAERIISKDEEVY